MPSPQLQRHLRIGVLTVALSVTFFVLSASVALATSAITSMNVTESGGGDLGSGGTEWSGATFNPDHNVLMVVDDETKAYEITLDSNGRIDHDISVRVIDLDFGVEDFEGVAWLADNSYAFLSEATGVAYIIDVPTSGPIRPQHIEWQFTAGGPDGNTGSEGIAVDSTGYFYVVDEMPASLSKYTPTGTFVAKVALPQLSDAAGALVAADDTYLVLSQADAKLVHYSIDWTLGTQTVLSELDLGDFAQVEGLAARGNSDLYLLGEQGAGLSYAHLNGQIIVEYASSDVICSGSMDVIDALLIAQVSAGTAQTTAGCGDGDVNDDGRSNVIDSLMIAQCSANLRNALCPAG